MMGRSVDNFSDQGLMTLHIIFSSTLVSGKYTAEQERILRITHKARYLHDKLLQRVPVSHLWEIEKLQRDLNLLIK